MNNTILKFKQGRKIMKFLSGGKDKYIGKAKNGDLIYQDDMGLYSVDPKTGLRSRIPKLYQIKGQSKTKNLSFIKSAFDWAIKLAEPAVQTARYYYNVASPFIPQLPVMPAIVNKTVDTIYPKSKFSLKLKSNKISSTKEKSSSSIKQEVKNKKAVEVPESILMTELSPELLKVDLSTANRIPVVSLQESTPTIVTINPVASLKVLPEESTIKVTLDPYANSKKTFTGNWIRSQRPLYSNVNELYDFINTYKDSRESLLIRNTLGDTFTYDLFVNLMKNTGVRGNLGRRDSGRLANYFNSVKFKNGGLLSRNPIEKFKLGKGIKGKNNSEEGLKVLKQLKLLNLLGNYNLVVDGYWGKKTLAVYEDYMKNKSKNSPIRYFFKDKENSNLNSQNPNSSKTNQVSSNNDKKGGVRLLQKSLWNRGAFKNVIDKRTGKPITYERAVDGIIGPMTQLALKNNSEILKEPIPQLKEESILPDFGGIAEGLKNLIFGKDYVPSSNINLLGLMDHKVKTGVKEPYFYVSPKEGKMYRIQGDLILYETPVATGVNFNSDGHAPLLRDENGNAIYDRSLALSATPAGVFTLGKPEENEYHGEPMFRLVKPSTNISYKPDTIGVAMHAPATPERQKRMLAGEKGLTYGCILLPNGQMLCLYNKGLINEGDSVYVEPSVEGNYLYEDKDGHIKTFFKETPKKVSGKVWGKEFNLDNVTYNTGY